MALFYKPADGWAADVIPFFWQGEYHLFYLKDFRDPAGQGPGTPWEHLGTRDFVRFTEYPTALPRGSRDEQDLYVFTGSVIERAGQFHIFYTGHNPFLMEQGRPQEAILHATSPDLMTWTKDPDLCLLADPARHEPHDWRDPFVFWNEEAGEYWMLLAARRHQGPARRRGCLALLASPDLVHWQARQPFWAPNLYHTHECPDLFRLGDWWYLLYSTFSERHLTHYRMSRSLAGPWLAPHDDALDGRAFYAAKTVSDGRRRFLCGWNPTREGETDTGTWQWGGHLVTHEIVQAPDGALQARPVPALTAAFTAPWPMAPAPVLGEWRAEGTTLHGTGGDGYAACRLGEMPASARVTATLTLAPGTRAAGILLRADAALDRSYEVRLEPGAGRLVVDRWPRPGDEPFMLERPLPLAAGQPCPLTIVAEGSVIEVYVADRVALSTRGYDHTDGEWGLVVYEGQATFADCQIAALPAAGQ